MNKTAPQAFVSVFNAGHPGVTTSINQASLPEAFERFMRESRKINAADVSHRAIIGKIRDGMSSPRTRCATVVRPAPRVCSPVYCAASDRGKA